MKHRLLPFILPIFGLKAYAYTEDNFLGQMQDEGIDITFVDQHENIIMFLLGLLLCSVAGKLIKEKDTRFAIVFTGIIIVLYAAVNMLFGATYGEYLLYSIPAILIICLLTYFIFSSQKPCITGKIFLSIPIFVFTLILMAFWNYFIDYQICDSHSQWPSEYGLQWRPIYQGFTDENHFRSVEKHIDSTDSDGVLEQLLIDEINTTNHPFDILKDKGWAIGESNGVRFFVNPSSKGGYIQVIKGCSLIPYYSEVIRIEDLFKNINLTHLKEIYHTGDDDNNEFVAVTEEADSTCFFVAYDENRFAKGGLVTIADSILSLPDWREINPYKSDPDESWFHVKKDYYVASEFLKFPTDTIREIDFKGDLGFVVRFNNPQAQDKLISTHPYQLARLKEIYFQ